MKKSYCEGILDAFEYLLSHYDESFVIGQGLWSPWYVGESMRELDVKFGTERIIDTPVSESACTGMAVGAAIAGMKPIVVHPRMDFMMYALDALVNQASKWSYMFGGQASAGLTVRAIINRGGEQGAQHSQALHAWFSHIPGLRVFMPYSPRDARDLLVAATISNDPVMYIDDRWLYELEEDLPEIEELAVESIRPKRIVEGEDLTLVGCGYSVKLALDAADYMEKNYGITCDVIDLRVLNPFYGDAIIDSIEKTGCLVAIDGGWRTCGISSEVLACAAESGVPLRKPAKRITLPDAPAPTSEAMEQAYYPKVEQLIQQLKSMFDL